MIPNPFIQYLSTFELIHQEARDAIASRLSSFSLDKDELLTKEGQVCQRLFFLVSGCIRGYHYKDGREVTNWFGFENDIVTSFRSFIDRQPGHEYIQAIEPVSGWSIRRDELYALYQQHPAIERLGRITCEQYYIRLEDRYVNGHFKTAGQRYEDLMNSHPHFLQRVPLGYIASYLGISQETLSRIRSKK